MPKNMKSELLKMKKLVHPNSRKIAQISKKLNKYSTRERAKFAYQVRQSLLVDKFLWFRDNLEPGAESYSPDMLLKLVELYLHRFDNEMEQIKLKHSVGGHRGRQHASREDTVKLTLLHDEEEFNTCGIELPDLMSKKQLNILRTWDGDTRFLQHFKLQRFGKKWLQSKMQKSDSTKASEKNDLPESSTASENVPESSTASENVPESSTASENVPDSSVEIIPDDSSHNEGEASTSNEKSNMETENKEVDQSTDGESKPENKISEQMEIDSQ